MKYSILVGLPGSGKSSWAENQDEKDLVKVLNCDTFFNNTRIRKMYWTLDDFIYGELMNVNRSYRNEIIIDGLFTTNDDVIKVIKALDDLIESDDEIQIHQWDCNRDQCIKNDLYRREKDSKADINNLPYEEINISDIQKHVKDVNISIENHLVYEKPIYQIMADKYGIKYDKYDNVVQSSKWITGGSWGNCWGTHSNVSSDEPSEFTEFDKLLEGICPELSFLKYKSIRTKCVTVEYTTDHGYYGSHTDYNYYECNLKDLYEILKELDIISDEDILNN